MDILRDRWNFYPFYRTLSPIVAAALLPPKKTKEKVEQGKRTADHLMPLGNLLNYGAMALETWPGGVFL